MVLESVDGYKLYKVNYNEIRRNCEKILRSKIKDNTPFNPVEAIHRAISDSKHPKAIFETIRFLADNWDDIGNPWYHFNSFVERRSKIHFVKDRDSKGFFRFIKDENLCTKLCVSLGIKNVHLSDKIKDISEAMDINIEGIEYIRFNCIVTRETPKAFRVSFGVDDCWIPKSQIKFYGNVEANKYSFTIPKWLAIRNYII